MQTATQRSGRNDERVYAFRRETFGGWCAPETKTGFHPINKVRHTIHMPDLAMLAAAPSPDGNEEKGK